MLARLFAWLLSHAAADGGAPSKLPGLDTPICKAARYYFSPPDKVLRWWRVAAGRRRRPIRGLGHALPR